MSRLLKWIVTAMVLAGLAGLGTWAFVQGRKELAAESQAEAPIKAAPRVSQTPEGQVVVTLDRAAQERIGLRTEPLAAQTVQPQVVAYGTLEEDPSQVFVLRAPIAGRLQTASGAKWPGLDDVLPDAAAVGAVIPQFAPAEQVDLASKLASAKADVAATEASLAADRQEYERVKELNAQGKIASDQVVQAASAKVTGDEARLQAARQTQQVIQEAMAKIASPGGPASLAVERGGHVVEVPAQPGELVQAGQAILKVVQFDTLLAKVTVLLGQKVDPSVSATQIVVAGFEDHVLAGERVGLAPAVSAKTLGQTFLFRIHDGKLGLRPGMAVTAYVPATGQPRQGVVVPRQAIVYFGGRAWAYAQQDDMFVRRQVAVEQPVEQGWFVTGDWREGDHVLVAGAQVLLSEELKSQIQIAE